MALFRTVKKMNSRGNATKSKTGAAISFCHLRLKISVRMCTEIPCTWYFTSLVWDQNTWSRFPCWLFEENPSNRASESTKASSANSFTKHDVNELFTKLLTMLHQYKCLPSRIYTLDETVLTTVLKSRKIVAMKGFCKLEPDV